jgi:hypothetical protein
MGASAAGPVTLEPPVARIQSGACIRGLWCFQRRSQLDARSSEGATYPPLIQNYRRGM